MSPYWYRPGVTRLIGVADFCMVRQEIQFILDGQIITLKDVDPTRTVLQYLREDLIRTGTKEGCAEGDCGACTVVLAELVNERVQYRAVNACIQFLPTLDGKALFTVESLNGRDHELHPVQQAMVECHGSQCGFCTPGFVMSLFALYKTQTQATRREIDDCLAGNLCRCTGYRPIVDAAQRMYQISGNQTIDDSALAGQLRGIQPRENVAFVSFNKAYFAPSDLEELANISVVHQDACLLAGGTDVGLWVTKQHQQLNKVIYIGNVAELKQIRKTEADVEIGSAVTLTDAIPVILEEYPELSDLFLRFASPPIRNTGTLGGNIANGSPIGDSMPALITLDASLVLRLGEDVRELPLDEFYIDYQKNARKPGEFVQAIRIPRRIDSDLLRSYKISKRFDQDISAVCAAFHLRLHGNQVDFIRVAYGGVAAVPERAFECESCLSGRDWDEAAITAAMNAIAKDFSPIEDMRATDQYRRTIIKNLLYKFYLETSADQQTFYEVYNYGR